MHFPMRRRITILGVALLVGCGPAFAGSLAGKVGDRRYPVNIPWGSIGGCQKGYNDYIAAGGHSAYASTVMDRTAEHFICGVVLNAPSQKRAEALALKSCQASVKKYKVQLSGACSIAASK